jgi:hypothetical protein
VSNATRNTAVRNLRKWWSSPSRSGLRLIISPVEYRHLRVWGRVRIVSGIVLAGLGTATLCFGGKDRKTYGWATSFLTGASANLVYGYWELSIARRPTRAPGPRPAGGISTTSNVPPP